MEETKANIIKQLQLERGRFEAILTEISDADKVEAQVEVEWTIKDLMAHITAWEKDLLRWLDLAVQNKAPDVPAPGEWDDFIERFNAAAYLANRDRSLAEVTADWQQVYQQVVLALDALPDDPANPYWSLWGGQAPWDLFAEYYKHYPDHLKSIRAWLDAGKN